VCQTTLTRPANGIIDRDPVTVMISAEGIVERLAQLPTRKEMYRAVLLGVTTGACR
jgi:hypothetical protein